MFMDAAAADAGLLHKIMVGEKHKYAALVGKKREEKCVELGFQRTFVWFTDLSLILLSILCVFRYIITHGKILLSILFVADLYAI